MKRMIKWYWNILTKRLRWKDYIALIIFARIMENLSILKYYTFEKRFVLSIICTKRKNEDENIFNEEELIEILKILSLIENI